MGRRTGDGAELAIIELVDNAREKKLKPAPAKRTKGSTRRKRRRDKVDGTGRGQEGRRRKRGIGQTLWVGPDQLIEPRSGLLL